MLDERQASSPAERVRAVLKAVARFEREDPQQGMARLQEAVQLADEDETLWAECQLGVARLAYHTVQYRTGLEAAFDALTFYRKQTDELREMHAQYYAGRLYATMGDYPSALEAFIEVRRLARVLDDGVFEARALDAIGVVQTWVGDLAEARATLRSALSLSRGHDAPDVEADILDNLGNVSRELGLLDEALEHDRAALILHDARGSIKGQAAVLSSMAATYRQQADLDAAQEAAQRSLTLSQKVGALLAEAHSLFELGQIALALEDTDAALDTLTTALAIIERVGEPRLEARIHQTLSDIHERRGDLQAALLHHRTFYRVQSDVDHERAVFQRQALLMSYQAQSARWEADLYRVLNAELRHEIAERKRAERQLRKLSAIVEQSSDLVFTTDVNGIIDYANAAFMEFTGFKNVIGKTPDILRSNQQEKGFFQGMWRTILSGKTWHGRVINRKADGSVFIEDKVISPLTDENGRTKHFVSTGRDVTAQIEMEAERDQLIADLNSYTRMVAHDLKSPLATLRGYVELIDLEVQDQKWSEIPPYLGLIQRNITRMNSIIDELLLLASVRRMAEVPQEALFMSYVVNGALERLHGLIEKHDARIIHPSDWPTALGHAPWVEEVWANYISNAIKYGGIPPTVELGADASSSGKVRFWVRDNGAGLTPEEQSRLFVQGERLGQTRAEGHGLGLWVVKRVVSRLGGHVGVESAPGGGCIFWFTLPTALPRL